MEVRHFSDIPPERVVADGAEGVTIRWLISKKNGAPNFAMRFFEVQPGGSTPLHTHEWEHEVYILNGTGNVWKDGAEHPVGPGTAILVSPMEEHRFSNTGDTVLQFLCMIPVYAEK